MDTTQAEIDALHAECDRLTAMLDHSKWRCENCKHWEKTEDASESYGKCNNFTKLIFGHDSTRYVNTPGNFGCVIFEEKEI